MKSNLVLVISKNKYDTSKGKLSDYKTKLNPIQTLEGHTKQIKKERKEAVSTAKRIKMNVKKSQSSLLKKLKKQARAHSSMLRM